LQTILVTNCTNRKLCPKAVYAVLQIGSDTDLFGSIRIGDRGGIRISIRTSVIFLQWPHLKLLYVKLVLKLWSKLKFWFMNKLFRLHFSNNDFQWKVREAFNLYRSGFGHFRIVYPSTDLGNNRGSATPPQVKGKTFQWIKRKRSN
jgi:hypothetical protein